MRKRPSPLQQTRKTAKEIAKGLAHLDYGSAVSHSPGSHPDDEQPAEQKPRNAATARKAPTARTKEGTVNQRGKRKIR
jgi:hypothetical protein